MIAGLYILVLILGHNTVIEIESKPALTLEQCYKAGEKWANQDQKHKYECRRINLTQQAKPVEQKE